MGNWEIAAHLLKQNLKGLRLLLYMGIQQKEQIERLQKEALMQSGIRIIAVEKDGGSPMDLVEGLRFIEAGGLVSMTGDLVWKREQRTIPVQFLGREILLPEVPHVLALLSGAPMFIFFALRTTENRYRFTVTAPMYLKAASRRDRESVIRASAQAYARVLEETLRQHPLQWYHFKPFVEPEKKGEISN
jgi:predicted LPLAT superfamily acyltransferase